MKLYIENLGCAKNQVDAEVLAYQLKSLDYELTLEVSDADLIIVNTCGFIQSAKEESINTFFELREKYPDKKIIISGCLAQRYADDLFAEMPEADAIFGNMDLKKIKDVVRDVQKNVRTVKRPSCAAAEDQDDTRDRLFNFPGSAYLKISEGCNHRCGYCAIPVIRGPLMSRPMDAVVKEATRLVATGIKEINLVAQDLAAYGYDWDSKSHFVELLQNLAKIDGDFKLRLLYIHPDWMTDDIIAEVKNNPKVLKYFDIPFQHASAKLLRPMKRTGDQEVYAQLIEKIRREIPEAVVRTTIMLGFPGDSKEDFDIVYEFIKRCRFNWMGSFVYSREEDTEAYNLTTDEEHEKLALQAAKWQKKLENLQEKISHELLQGFVGNEYDVLIEELIEGEDLAIGRIYAQAPEVDGLTVVMGRDMVPGNVYRCGITKVNGMDFEAAKIDR